MAEFKTSYVSTTTSPGYRQNYTRLPARYGIGRIRLPDDRAEAEAMVTMLIPSEIAHHSDFKSPAIPK